MSFFYDHPVYRLISAVILTSHPNRVKKLMLEVIIIVFLKFCYINETKLDHQNPLKCNSCNKSKQGLTHLSQD